MNIRPRAGETARSEQSAVFPSSGPIRKRHLAGGKPRPACAHAKRWRASAEPRRPRHAHALDHPHLAGVSRRQPDTCPRDVLLTLHTFRGIGGAVLAVARDAGRPGAVLRQDGRARAGAGSGPRARVTWAERRVRAGWRWLRTSNLYRLAVPATSVQFDPRLCGGALGPHRIGRIARPILTTGLNARGGESLRKKEALNELLRAAAAAPDLLALRRAAMEGGEGARARLASFAR